MLLEHKKFFHRCIRKSALGLASLCLLLSQSTVVLAEASLEERAAAQRAMTVQSNQVENWPQGPAVTAEAAILMDADTGAILYAKNIHEREYPASTTKILTTLIAAEECSLDEEVTFSYDAVFSVPRDSNHIAMDVDQSLTMEDCLNAILIRSANEVSNAVAEHIGGTIEAFADKMNERAKELGCVDSHFVNPNGLPDEQHYTSAYDLAQIGRAFFANEMLCRISTTRMMHILPSENQPQEKKEVSSNQMLEGGKYEYEYLVGAKTGYTNAARSCLVSCAEKNGMKLICVVMRDESPLQYEDTISLFEYGFSNFDKVNISQTETKYNLNGNGFFYSENDIFGSSRPLLSLNQEDYILLPETISFEDTVSSISYDTEDEAQAAVISYTYQDVFLGSASLDFTAAEEAYSFESPASQDPQKPFIFVNIIKVLISLAGAAALFLLLILVKNLKQSYRLAHPGSRYAWRRRRRQSRHQHPAANRSLQKRRQEQIRQAKQRRKVRRKSFRDYD